MTERREILVFDIGERAELLKWDGSALRIEESWAGLPEECWADWVTELGGRAGHDVILRLKGRGNPEGEKGRRGEGEKNADCAGLEALASEHGARSLRVVSDGVDPCLWAAREVMRRQRMAGAICLELDRRYKRLTWVDRVGAARQVEQFGVEAPTAAQVETLRAAIVESFPVCTAETIDRLLSPVSEETAYATQFWRVRLALNRMARAARRDAGSNGAASVGLICYGNDGVMRPTGLAMLSDFSTLVVPAHAEAFARVGLLLSDLVLEAEEALGEKTGVDSAGLRRVFRRLMDGVGAQVTMQGYDLDDAVCERFVEMGYTGDMGSVWVGAEMSGGVDSILELGRERLADQSGEPAGGQGIEIRRARVSATVETMKPILPPRAVMHGPTVSECDCMAGLDGSGRLTQDAAKSAVANAYEAARLTTGARMDGPAMVIDLTRRWLLDEGWWASVEASGDVVAKRAS